MLEVHAPFQVSAMTASLPSLPEMHGVDRARFEAEVLPGDTAVILRGVAADWPAVAKGRESPLALAQYLATMDNGVPVDALMTRPEEGGRLPFRLFCCLVEHRTNALALDQVEHRERRPRRLLLATLHR